MIKLRKDDWTHSNFWSLLRKNKENVPELNLFTHGGGYLPVWKPVLTTILLDQNSSIDLLFHIRNAEKT